jgi:hypothetical protein
MYTVELTNTLLLPPIYARIIDESKRVTFCTKILLFFLFSPYSREIKLYLEIFKTSGSWNINILVSRRFITIDLVPTSSKF